LGVEGPDAIGGAGEDEPMAGDAAAEAALKLGGDGPIGPDAKGSAAEAEGLFVLPLDPDGASGDTVTPPSGATPRPEPLLSLPLPLIALPFPPGVAAESANGGSGMVPAWVASKPSAGGLFLRALASRISFVRCVWKLARLACVHGFFRQLSRQLEAPARNWEEKRLKHVKEQLEASFASALPEHARSTVWISGLLAPPLPSVPPAAGIGPGARGPAGELEEPASV
jgi:hypothetical protein